MEAIRGVGWVEETVNIFVENGMRAIMDEIGNTNVMK